MDANSIGKKLENIASNVQKVYEAGIAKGASIYSLPIESAYVTSTNVDTALQTLNENQGTELSRGDIQVVKADKLSSIGPDAFKNMDSLRIIMPLYRQNNISSIGEHAFENCTALEIADLRSAKTIGAYAFNGCTNLKKVLLRQDALIYKNAFTGISNEAYRECNLESNGGVTGDYLGTLDEDPVLLTNVKANYRENGICVTIPADVPYLIGTIVDKWGSIKELHINHRITTDVAYLKDVTLKPWSFSLGLQALSIYDLFYGWDKEYGGYLNELFMGSEEPSASNNITHVPSTLKKLTIHGGTIKANALKSCRHLENVTLGDMHGCRVLINALRGCYSLKELTIGRFVSEIGRFIVRDCNELQTINVENGSNFNQKGADYFSNNGELHKKLTIYQGSSLVLVAPYTEITDIKIPSDTTGILNGAICDIPNLTSITIPPKVKQIESYFAFDCEKLNTLTCDEKNEKYFVETVTYITRYPDTGALEATYTLGYALYERYTEDNKEKYKLVRVTPNNDKDDCDLAENAGEKFSVKENTTHILSGAFNFYCGVSDVKIPSSVESIANDAFSDCSGLTLHFYGDEPEGFPYSGKKMNKIPK